MESSTAQNLPLSTYKREKTLFSAILNITIIELFLFYLQGGIFNH